MAAIAISKPASSQGLIISNGGYLVANTAHIVINEGSLVNSGTFAAGGGTVDFTGALPASVSGTSSTSFNNIVLSKAGNTLTLLQHIYVAGSVGLGSGNIDLNGYNLDLGPTGVLNGETASSRVLGSNGGFIMRSAEITASGSSVNPGNLGMLFTPASNLGHTVIKRGHQSQQLGGAFGINRFFDVTATNGTTAKEDVTFRYFDDELNGVAEKELGVYYVTAANTAGTLQTQKAFDSVANTIEINNAAFAGKYVLASNISDPARATDLVATLIGNKADLTWTTLYEINTDHFELERIVDKGFFQYIGSLPAATTATSATNYYFTDPQPVEGPYTYPSPRYYRYKVFFKDGSYRYSNTASVAPVGYPNSVLQVNPNPTTGPVNVKFSSFIQQKVYLEVVSNAGVIVARQEMNAVVGPNSISCDISHVTPGVYYVRMVNISRTAYMIVKQ